MPVTVGRRGGKYRIIDPSTGAIETTPSGQASRWWGSCHERGSAETDARDEYGL